ncbi:phosphoribosylformylglycinamidine synthase subunit PurL [Candidatus Bathyarchaeota archaeon]|nr:phosphoribosylformylglycinamidine synthase subunit PurL [Candidatus Bathyarchaeota archaeon]
MNRITKSDHSFDHYIIDLLNATDDELNEIAKTLGLGLSLQELRFIRDHYLIKEKKATDIELQTYDQTYSEHCSHKTFKGFVNTPEGTINGLLKSYIKKETDEINAPWCYSVFEDNAGIVDLSYEIAVAIKVETHNHPSAIEPFGGAATGLGGVIRDILGVWANPIACTDVLCFGPLNYPYNKLPEGVKHPSYLFNGVIDGIGSYGNSIGIPTVNGATVFDEDYTGNVVVYAGCIGVLRKEEYVKEVKKGDYVVLAGGKTGLDGIHGVTFASAELTKESETTSRPAVQVGNPIEEEKLKRAIKQISEERLGSGITDIGGGGISCGVCETADKYNLGVQIDLDKIPLKAAKMAPWEIWISESQERMLLAVPPKNLEKVIQIFKDEQTDATAIGRYDDSGLAKLFYHEVKIAEIDLKSLFEPPKTTRISAWIPPKFVEPELDVPTDLGLILKKMLASYNIASKEKVVRRYDHEVKGQTVVKPLQGWNAGPNNAAVLKPLEDSLIGVVVSSGLNPRFGKIDPYWMAASSIDEAYRNNIAVGGRRIALLDNFTWGNPEYPDRMGSLVEACKACYEIGKTYEAPFISGKDSLYNESPLGPVAPTLLITALGIIPDITTAVTMDLKKPGSSLYIIGETKTELGGSEYYNLYGYLGNLVPKVDAQNAINSYKKLTTAIDSKLVLSCHDLSDGGLGVALAETSFTGGLGIKINLEKVPVSEEMRLDYLLFSESNSRLLVEVSDNNAQQFEKIMQGTKYSKIGTVTSEPQLEILYLNKKILREPLNELIKAWKTPLEGPR